jgi:hypothetical protein
MVRGRHEKPKRYFSRKIKAIPESILSHGLMNKNKGYSQKIRCFEKANFPYFQRILTITKLNDL